MSTVSTIDGGRLFVDYERWGWEYLDPGAAEVSPLLDYPPQLIEPIPPQIPVVKSGSLAKRIIGLTAFALFFIPLLAVNAVFFIFLFIIAAILLLPIIFKKLEASGMIRTYQRECAQARQAYEAQLAQWEQAILSHNAQEQRRIGHSDLWRPVALRSPTDRIDVVGGIPEGWRELLVTFGSTVVARRLRMLVLDLTQENVVAGLAAVSSRMGQVDQVVLPRDGDRLDLLRGMAPDDAAELLAQASETLRGTSDPAMRVTDADILRSVAHRLNAPLTTRRLAAGIRVLQRTFDGGNDLSVEEVTRLNDQIDMVGTGERVQDQLRFLRVALDLLANEHMEGDAAVGIMDLWRGSQLTTVSTDHPIEARKDFTDRVLFHSLMQALRDPRTDVSGRVLVVAGADHLGPAALEAMAKLARSRGLRLIYFFEHLQEGAQRLLGNGHSATVIMRLGHPTEAATAAEYIGRGYTFKLSQTSQQWGTTDTTGSGESWGTSTSDSTSTGAGGGSRSISTSTSEQTQTNQSTAVSKTDGTTLQRVYEFQVEPQAIQTLPLTAFVLVEGTGQRRRAVAADGHPNIATFDRVASTPGHPVIA